MTFYPAKADVTRYLMYIQWKLVPKVSNPGFRGSILMHEFLSRIGTLILLISTYTVEHRYSLFIKGMVIFVLWILDGVQNMADFNTDTLHRL